MGIGKNYSCYGAARLSTYSEAYKQLVQGISLEVQSMIRAKSSTGSSVKSVLKEGGVLEKSHHQLKIAGGNLGNKPLIVITAGKPLEEQSSILRYSVTRHNI